MPEDIVDLAIVGGGVSGSLSLVHFIHGLHAERKTMRKPLRIILFDGDGQFGAGLAYGTRSGAGALLISPLKGAVPEAASAELFRFLLAYREQWTAELEQDPINRVWLSRHRAAVDAGRFEDLYLPRMLLKAFFRKKLDDAVQIAADQNIADIQFITATVRKIIREDTGFAVQYSSDTALSCVHSRRVLLAAGLIPPPPRTGFPKRDDIIGNIYAPSLPENVQRLTSIFSTGKASGRLVLVGSNAAALEMLYHIRHTKALRKSVTAISMISTSGRLPDLWREPFQTPTDFPQLAALQRDHRDKNADDVIAAALADIVHVRKMGYLTVDFSRPLLERVFSCLAKMPYTDQRNFMERYSQQIIRQVGNVAGADYLDAAHELVADGTLQLIRGRYRQTQCPAGGEPEIEYQAAEDGKFSYVSASAVVLCTGYPALQLTADPLITQLYTDPTCGMRINQGGRGFDVDDHFQAVPGFFVLGSLLSGICNAYGAYFDLENTARLWMLSELVARELVHCFESE